MADLHEVFSGTVGPGLHALDREVTAEDLAEMAAGHGWLPVVLDLTAVADKAGLLDRLAEATQAPDHAGRNWDALQDVMGDLDWLGPTEGYLVVLDGWDRFAGDDPTDAEVLESVLSVAATEWAARGTPFVTLTL